MRKRKSLAFITLILCLFFLACGSHITWPPATQAGQNLTFPYFQAFDSNGAPLTGGLVYTYTAGGSTPRATYPTAADASAGTNANANPVVLDSDGKAAIYLSGTYKIILKTAAGVTLWTKDVVQGQGASVLSFRLLSDYASLSAAVTAIGVTETTLWIDTDDTLSATVTIPSTLATRVLNGAIISNGGGAANLVINGPFEAGLAKCFDFTGSGTVRFGPGSAVEVYPIWWQENTTPGTTDMSTAFKAWNDSVVQTSATAPSVTPTFIGLSPVLVCPPGRYLLSSPFIIGETNKYQHGTKIRFDKALLISTVTADYAVKIYGFMNSSIEGLFVQSTTAAGMLLLDTADNSEFTNISLAPDSTAGVAGYYDMSMIGWIGKCSFRSTKVSQNAGGSSTADYAYHYSDQTASFATAEFTNSFVLNNWTGMYCGNTGGGLYLRGATYSNFSTIEAEGLVNNTAIYLYDSQALTLDGVYVEVVGIGGTLRDVHFINNCERITIKNMVAGSYYHRFSIRDSQWITLDHIRGTSGIDFEGDNDHIHLYHVEFNVSHAAYVLYEINVPLVVRDGTQYIRNLKVEGCSINGTIWATTPQIAEVDQGFGENLITDPGMIETAKTFVFIDADVTVAADTVTEALHSLQTGKPARLTTTGTLPAGLALTTTYYVVRIDDNTIGFASTYANALAGTLVNITAAAGGGNHTLTTISYVLSGMSIAAGAGTSPLGYAVRDITFSDNTATHNFSLNLTEAFDHDFPITVVYAIHRRDQADTMNMTCGTDIGTYSSPYGLANTLQITYGDWIIYVLRDIAPSALATATFHPLFAEINMSGKKLQWGGAHFFKGKKGYIPSIN